VGKLFLLKPFLFCGFEEFIIDFSDNKDWEISREIFIVVWIRHRHKISNPPELLEFMKCDPFLIFWWLFCRNPWKIEYENEVCFEACRLPNFF
jgi:hypothetical protein